jgi:hypothetical protein
MRTECSAQIGGTINESMYPFYPPMRPEPGKESDNLKVRAARYAARAELLKGQSAKMLVPPPALPDSNCFLLR